MKKLSVFITILYLLYLAGIFYVDVNLKLESLNWLIGKMAGVVLIFMALIFDILGQKKKLKVEKAISICVLIFWVGYYGYHEVSLYNKNVRLNKYGPAFNQTRRRLGVPEIPVGWEKGYSRDRSVDWKTKDTTIGHQTKSIDLDSLYKIKFEEDQYKLKTIDSMQRYISIRTRYARGRAKDSIFYYYNPGDSTRDISRQKADSIFAAENIKKDY